MTADRRMWRSLVVIAAAWVVVIGVGALLWWLL